MIYVLFISMIMRMSINSQSIIIYCHPQSIISIKNAFQQCITWFYAHKSVLGYFRPFLVQKWLKRPHKFNVSSFSSSELYPASNFWSTDIQHVYILKYLIFDHIWAWGPRVFPKKWYLGYFFQKSVGTIVFSVLKMFKKSWNEKVL